MGDHIVEENRHSLEVQTRLVSETDRLVDYVASTQKVDRYNTRLMTWDKDSLDRYRANPVVLYAHNPVMPPVGRTVALEWRDNESGVKEMHARIQYAPKSVYAFADTIYQLTRHGYLKGLSVGFANPRAERNDELNCVDYNDIHLRELSTVPVPGNADTLAMAVRSGAIPKEHERLMVMNYAMRADHIEGVEDLATLGGQLIEWVNDYDSSLSRSFDEEPEVTAPKKEDPIVVRTDTTTMNDTVTTDKIVLDVVKADDPLAGVARHAIRTIAAIIDFDLADLGTEEGVARLCSAVQESCSRSGAPLSKRSVSKLNEVIDALVDIRSVVVSGQEPPADIPAQPDKEVTADDSVNEERLANVENALGVIAKAISTKGRVDSARALIEVATDGDKNGYLEQILKRISG